MAFPVVIGRYGDDKAYSQVAALWGESRQKFWVSFFLAFVFLFLVLGVSCIVSPEIFVSSRFERSFTLEIRNRESDSDLFCNLDFFVSVTSHIAFPSESGEVLPLLFWYLGARIL